MSFVVKSSLSNLKVVFMSPISLPVYDESYRPSSNWVQDVLLKREALRKLAPLSPEITARIDEHLLVEQVVHNLVLGDISISRATVRALIAGENAPANDAERACISFANAVKHLNTLINDSESKAQFLLSSDLLRELHALTMAGIGSDGGYYRQQAGKSLAPGHEPAGAEILPLFIDNALDWFSVQSFQELHPLEQAWLVHLRLTELQPFARANGRVVRLAASLFAQRSDICPIIISSQDRDLYKDALVNSFQMITQPGIDLFARSVIRTLDEMIAIVNE